MNFYIDLVVRNYSLEPVQLLWSTIRVDYSSLCTALCELFPLLCQCIIWFCPLVCPKWNKTFFSKMFLPLCVLRKKMSLVRSSASCMSKTTGGKKSSGWSFTTVLLNNSVEHGHLPWVTQNKIRGSSVGEQLSINS